MVRIGARHASGLNLASYGEAGVYDGLSVQFAEINLISMFDRVDSGCINQGLRCTGLWRRVLRDPVSADNHERNDLRRRVSEEKLRRLQMHLHGKRQ